MSSTTSNYEAFRNLMRDEGIENSLIIPKGDSVEYKDSNYQWNLKLGYVYPKAYILPRTETEVVKIVRSGIATNTRLVALSGGHSYEKHSYGDSDSIVIDFRKMSSIYVNEVKKTVEVGPGALIGPITFELWDSAQAHIPGGFCPTVGIVGFSTGGGHGVFFRSLGILTDYLKEVNIVIGDGSLITANKVTNPDLFWALRGGGAGSFGIITKLTFKTLPAPPIISYLEIKYFEVSSFPEVFDNWQRLLRASTLSNSISVELIVGLPSAFISLKFVDISGTLSELELIRKEFPSPNYSLISTKTFPEFLQEVFLSGGDQLTKKVQSDLINSFAGLKNITRKSQAPNLIHAKSFFVKEIAEIQKLESLLPLLEELPDGTILIFSGSGGAIRDLKEDETAYIHRGETLYLTQSFHSTTQTDPLKINLEENWSKNFFELSRDVFNHNESYQNVVDKDMHDYLDRFYGKNLRRLVDVKKKYDPMNYFHHPHSIPTNL